MTLAVALHQHIMKWVSDVDEVGHYVASLWLGGGWQGWGRVLGGEHGEAHTGRAKVVRVGEQTLPGTLLLCSPGRGPVGKTRVCESPAAMPSCSVPCQACMAVSSSEIS